MTLSLSLRQCLLTLLCRRLLKGLKFTEGGPDNRYVNLSRVDPSKFCLMRIGKSEFIAVTSLTSTRHKVVCNLQLGCVKYCNLIAGGKPEDDGSNNDSVKRCIRLVSPAYFGLRFQSAVSKIAPWDVSLEGQLGFDYLKFSTRLGTAGECLLV